MKIKFLLITAVLATAILCSAGSVKAVDNSALIAQLQAQIAQLMAQLKVLQAQQDTTQTWCHTFNTNLRFGDTGTEVGDLWTALNKEFPGDIMHISYDHEGMGQPNKIGDYTSAAIVAFQEKYASDILASYGLKHGTGYVGVTTRKKLNALYGCKTECNTDLECAIKFNDACATFPNSSCVSHKCILGKCVKETDITWNVATQAINNCEVSAVSQTHSRIATLFFKNGEKMVTVEPKLDDVMDIVESAKLKCGIIPIATE